MAEPAAAAPDRPLTLEEKKEQAGGHSHGGPGGMGGMY